MGWSCFSNLYGGGVLSDSTYFIIMSWTIKLHQCIRANVLKMWVEVFLTLPLFTKQPIQTVSTFKHYIYLWLLLNLTHKGHDIGGGKRNKGNHLFFLQAQSHNWFPSIFSSHVFISIPENYTLFPIWDQLGKNKG